MQWLERQPRRRARPWESLPGARSVVCVAAAYAARSASEGDPALSPGEGRVARYARGGDYHEAMDGPLRELERWIVRNGGGGHDGECAAKRFCDTGPLLERWFAQSAGLGFIGRHGLLITPRHGSWVALGAIATTAAFEPDAPGEGTCGRCRRCLEACPTGAFAEPGVLDARRCISNLTIERRGAFSAKEAAWLGEWIFGCDVCQEVCPYNKKGAEPAFAALGETRFAGGRFPLGRPAEIASNRAFELEFAGSPLLRPRLNGMRRNSAAVAENRSEQDT
ncbi:MAG: Epoxyqueuosine reductase [candidate division BRC1 bacterium ADurb.BinA364]|nr:MAG: Epoxyqueuosine reductase [candidate division BRC1 bacterium ADurb.BinA364]